MNYKEPEYLEIKKIQEEIKALVEKRTKLLDEYVTKYAELKIGDIAYDPETLRSIGVVYEHSRYHRGHYEFDSGDVTYRVDNGHGYSSFEILSEEQREKAAKRKIAEMERILLNE